MFNLVSLKFNLAFLKLNLALLKFNLTFTEFNIAFIPSPFTSSDAFGIGLFQGLRNLNYESTLKSPNLRNTGRNQGGATPLP